MAVTLKGQTAVYEGVSTDTKPTDADNNAIFKELDTGIRYYYDGADWNEIPSSGGGGGGTGTDNYNELNNKPSINGTVLSGNKSLDNLGIQAKLTFDNAPTSGSSNPVKSGGVYSALESKQDALSSQQLDAVNSGITSADVEQITTNKNNILSTCCVGTCTTAGNIAAKIVTIDDNNWTLRKGCIIGVKFTYSNNTSTDNVTLNVNNTGDKGIYFNNAVYTDHSTKVCGMANTYIYYMYDGTYWSWINFGFDATYGTMTQSEASTGTATNGRLISAKVLGDTIDEKLVPVENNIMLLSPTAYTEPRPNTNYNITIDSGGYFLCGKICYINVRLTVGTDIPNNTYFLYDLPEALTPLTAGSSICALNNNRGAYISVASQGNVLNASGAAITAGQLLLTGAYLIK